MRFFITGFLTILTAACLPGATATFLNQYCVACHNSKAKIGGLTLDHADLTNIPAQAEMWEKVIKKLRTGAMPPLGMPKPGKASVDEFATLIETSIDRAAAIKPDPGRPALHRLNRAEYANSIRDLLAL